MENEVRNVRLDVQDLTIRYGDVIAVDRTSLRIPECSITALVGPSGCGKTSLLRAIAGFETPDSGTIQIAGCDVATRPPERRSVGMVFQEGALFPHLTVGENVSFGIPRTPDRRIRLEQALAWAGMSDFKERYPDQLSGGQQQRVALARALAPAPEIVLLDEPFASLDAESRETLRDDVCRILREASATALIVTHDQEEALSLADRVAAMHRGRIRQIGTPSEIYDRPETAEVARFVGAGQLLPCSIANGRLVSVLGDTPCELADGDALLLIRAEDPIAGSRGVEGEIERRRFYGHDQLCRIKMHDGSRLELRGAHSDRYRVGDRLRLRLRPKRYRIFSREAEGKLLGQVELTDGPR